MNKIMLASISVLCIFITGCGTAPPKESPCVGLIVQAAAKSEQKSALIPTADDASQTDDARFSNESVGTEGEITGEDQNPVTIKKGLSGSEQLNLLEVSRKLNAIRKKIFSALDSISTMDMSNYSKATLGIIDEIEDALAETRHYLDHEAELIYTIPYIKDVYFDVLVENRLDGILKTREIIHLYKTNLEGLYKKLGKDADFFSPEDTLKHFKSSIEQLDKAFEILQPYGKGKE